MDQRRRRHGFQKTSRTRDGTCVKNATTRQQNEATGEERRKVSDVQDSGARRKPKFEIGNNPGGLEFDSVRYPGALSLSASRHHSLERELPS